MKYRRRMNKRTAGRRFKRGANRTHRKNMNYPMRGGYRL